MPLSAAVRGRHTVRVEPRGDCGVKNPPRPRRSGSPDCRFWHRTGTPDPHALSSLDGQSLSCALADHSPLPLREDSEYSRHRLSVRRRRIDVQVQDDEFPGALPASLDKGGESINERERRSSFATTSAAASPPSTALSAAWRPGRPLIDPPLWTSSSTRTSVQSRRPHSSAIA